MSMLSFSFKLSLFAFIQIGSNALFANDAPLQEMESPPHPTPIVHQEIVTPPSFVQAKSPFKAFSGKILRDRVRLRLEPSLEGAIVQEMSVNDLLVVLNETEDYYVVEAPSTIKGYVFRTYVLDDIVEGEHVNVRLEPDTEALVISQVNTGDKIKGSISEENNKWLKIDLPKTTKMYVFKDYIEKVGDANFLAKYEERKATANALLAEGRDLCQLEIEKPFEMINIQLALNPLNQVVENYSDFTTVATEANELLTRYQETYLKKKVAYLEARACTTDHTSSTPSSVTEVEQGSITQPKPLACFSHNYPQARQTTNWSSKEKMLFEAWTVNNPEKTVEDYYKEQQTDSVALSGILESYTLTVKNKPGNYVLLNPTNHLPIAYLYSTQVNLKEHLGKEVTISGADRPNNNFAFPAYFVFSVN